MMQIEPIVTPVIDVPLNSRQRRCGNSLGFTRMLPIKFEKVVYASTILRSREDQ